MSPTTIRAAASGSTSTRMPPELRLISVAGIGSGRAGEPQLDRAGRRRSGRTGGVPAARPARTSARPARWCGPSGRPAGRPPRPGRRPSPAATSAASPTLPMPATIAEMVPAISAVSRSSSSMVSAICSVDREVVVASSLTSSATTVKPRPSSPARAASMVAFSASSRVWPAMPCTSAAVAATRRRLCSSEAITSSARRAWSTTAEVAASVAEISLSMVSDGLPDVADLRGDLAAAPRRSPRSTRR